MDPLSWKKEISIISLRRNDIVLDVTSEIDDEKHFPISCTHTNEVRSILCN